MDENKTNYENLAKEFMEKMFKLNKARTHKQITESMQGESFMLKYIASHKCSVLPSEISSIMGISSARIAAILNALESRGLITRQIDKSDRRKILVNLTEEGKKIADTHHQEILNATIRFLKELGEHDAKEYVRITGRLVEITAGLTAKTDQNE